MAEFVEFISGGNLMLMLIFTAIISLILGMGLPTTANYIVVSSLMAPRDRGPWARSNGLIVPLIAVHLFVFYFGIMADVTPPVGLASFAAAAVSGGDPIKTGFGLLLFAAHGGAAVPLHLQHRAAADRRQPLPGHLHLHHGDGGDADASRRGDPGLLLRPQQDLGVGTAAADRLHPVPAGLLARSILQPSLSSIGRRPRHRRSAARASPPDGADPPARSRARTLDRRNGGQQDRDAAAGARPGDGAARLAENAGIELRDEDGKVPDRQRRPSAARPRQRQKPRLRLGDHGASEVRRRSRMPKEVFYIPALLLLGSDRGCCSVAGAGELSHGRRRRSGREGKTRVQGNPAADRPGQFGELQEGGRSRPRSNLAERLHGERSTS